jgi:hypothetical protein
MFASRTVHRVSQLKKLKFCQTNPFCKIRKIYANHSEAQKPRAILAQKTNPFSQVRMQRDKSRNCKTNPICLASYCHPMRNKEKFPGFMMNKTYIPRPNFNFSIQPQYRLEQAKSGQVRLGQAKK